MNKTDLGKRQATKLDSLSDFVEYALRNGFEETVRYLGNNSKHLLSNPSLVVSLDVIKNDCTVFAHRKVKKGYLTFILDSISESALKLGKALNLTLKNIRILPHQNLVGDEGPDKPDFNFTLPVLHKEKPILFINFSKYDPLSNEDSDFSHVRLISSLLSSLWEREEKERAEKENIERLSLIDPLTGVFNRRAFYQLLSQDISEGRRKNSPVSLAVFDIDEFKRINDSYGHAFGDMILKQVTSKFRDLLREEDKMFRLGGDEFAVIIKADKKETHSAIQRILKEVSDSRSPRITLSGGITGIEPDENISVDEAVRQADKALYLSKESGKNQVLLYEGGDRKSEYDDLFYRIADSKVIEDIKIKLKEFATEQITSSHLITKDPYIYKRSMAVSKQAVQLGKILKLSDNRVKSLRFGAILYDIGMIAVPEEILHKSSKLTPDEFEIIKYHPIIVARLIQQFPILRDVLPAVLYHHEWINGHGYPFGLVGDSIPLEARIIAVVDAFHAMHSDRPYRPILSLEDSISEIIKGSGTKYDPQVVEAFLSLMTERKLLA